ncbi:MAG: SPOR domain-containing protein [Treponema sp.]
MKKTFFTFLTLFCAVGLYAQNLTAKQIRNTALAKGNAQETLEYVKAQILSVKDEKEKRAVYVFLGSLQENLALYKDAAASYVAAAGIAGSDAEGMPKKTNPQLVIDAARCSLNAGDWESADRYLNSSVRNSANETIQAYIKLYEQWSALCRAETIEDTADAAAVLQSYLAAPEMSGVKPALLFTLWYITGEPKYASALKTEFPKSPEAGIVKGKTLLLPSPFWYFVPHKEAGGDTAVSAPEKAPAAVANAEPEETKTAAGKKAARKLQLGLFRSKENALAFTNKVKSDGFSAYIQEETRESGTTYYLVLVDESAGGGVADKLKSAGYESYPVVQQ